MRIFDIALKDMRQASRSLVAWMFMFVAPILVALLFFILFGGMSGDADDFTLPVTRLVVVNQDTGSFPQMPGLELPAGVPPVESMGDLLLFMLAGENLTDLVEMSQADEPQSARAMVEAQEVDVALLLPQNLTEALTTSNQVARIELYQDPDALIGPAIVKSIVSQMIDQTVAGQIGVSVTVEQLDRAGLDVSPQLREEIASRYIQKALRQLSGQIIWVEIEPISTETVATPMSSMLAAILGGMMVFFAFYTGVSMMQTILTEEERGTLPRLYTTPISHRQILAGKALATLFTLVIQVVVLLTFGWIVFDISWGDPLPVTIASIGLVLVAAASGAFLVSLLRNTKQGGMIFGGVLTLTGNLGLMTVFLGLAGQPPRALEIAAMLVPQGWAMRAYLQAFDRAELADLLLTFGVVLVWTIVFFYIGQARLKKRFA
jgi:ABC-2 type transport system permease protein